MGPNGIGKTNILEAISYLTAGKGLRGAHLKELLNSHYPSKRWAVFAKFALHHPNDHKDNFTVATAQAIEKDEKRVIYVDHHLIKTNEEILKKVWLLYIIPSMNHLFTASSQLRRKFFDKIIEGIEPHYKTLASKYNYYVKERNKILENNNDDVWLKTVEEKIAVLAIDINKIRKAFLADINLYLEDATLEFSRPYVDLDCNTLYQGDEETEVYQYVKNLVENRKSDRKTKHCNYGVHRADWIVTNQTKGIEASLSSTGEQKALVINIVLAALKLFKSKRDGVSLLLLDDILAHLDMKFQEYLYRALADLPVQTWISATEDSFFSQNGYKAVRL